MKKTSFIEDMREVKENWHDPDYRKIFLIIVAISIVISFVAAFLVTSVLILIT